MNRVSAFQVNELYTNDDIRFALDLENLGGIRPSIDSRKTLRHLAILTAETDAGHLAIENPYIDRIEGDILLYTAQGREGDQQLTGRNKRLIEQYSNPVPFYGFSNIGKQTYRFLGLLELLRHYQETQADKKGHLRKVWLFELRIHKHPDIVPVTNAAHIMTTLLTTRKKKAELERLDKEIGELGENVKEINVDIVKLEQIRHQLLQIESIKFEHFIKVIMERSGFVNVCVTPPSGDGGIDVNAYMPDLDYFFARTHVQVQVKRWRHAVGTVEINNFRGALSATAKGVFITTSVFTRGAISEAYHHAKAPIALLDGRRLSSLITEKRVDIDNFI